MKVLAARPEDQSPPIPQPLRQPDTVLIHDKSADFPDWQEVADTATTWAAFWLKFPELTRE